MRRLKALVTRHAKHIQCILEAMGETKHMISELTRTTHCNALQLVRLQHTCDAYQAQLRLRKWTVVKLDQRVFQIAKR